MSTLAISSGPNIRWSCWTMWNRPKLEFAISKRFFRLMAPTLQTVMKFPRQNIRSLP